MGVVIETVPVGNPGNANDTHGAGYGAVGYEYNIGKYEVTAGQYCEFLNAVAATDTYGLYNSSMNNDSRGCQITQNGTGPDNYTYDFSGKPSGSTADWENRPVNYVSWYDAAMFANYLTSGNVNNGAYNTSTGDPVYWGDSDASKYTGITARDSAEMDALVSTYGKVYVIPTEDEWYKAAYYDPSLNAGAGGYYEYPTSSMTVPSNDLTDPDGGNNATFYISVGDYTIRSPYWRTEVGAHENSESPYDTFDQGGNVWEWNEALYGDFRGGVRGLKGASFHAFSGDLRASGRNCLIDYGPTYGGYWIGFRVSQVPEPASLSLLAFGGLAMLRRRRR